MDPRISLFLWLNGAAVLLVVTYLLRQKNQRRGMRLKSKSSGSQGGADRHEVPPFNEKTEVVNPAGNDEWSDLEPSAAKSLNVIFTYNAHSWDAYEVLGVPAGSSLERVEKAYSEALKKVEEPSRPFIQAAYQAIRQTQS